MKDIKYILSPSLLSANFWNLEKDLIDIEKAGCKYLHLDVMDGTLSFQIIVWNADYKKLIKNKLNIWHSLNAWRANKVCWWFFKSGVDILTVHVEACKHLDRTIEYIKEKYESRVTLNPSTSLTTNWIYTR